MNRYIKSSLISVVTAATLTIFTGCGSSNESVEEPVKSYSPMKIDRTVYSGINSENSNATLSFNTEGSNIKISISNMESTNIVNNQFFINSDNDKSTGLSSVDGSDYLIESTHIFSSTGRNWSWQYIGEVSSYNVSDDLTSIDITFDKNNIDLQSDDISIVSIQRDRNWKTLEVTQNEFTINETNNNQNNNILTEDTIKSAVQRNIDNGTLPQYLNTNDMHIESISNDSDIAIISIGDGDVHFYVYDANKDELSLITSVNYMYYASMDNLIYNQNDRTVTYEVYSLPGGAAIPVPYYYRNFYSYNIDNHETTYVKTFQNAFTVFGLAASTENGINIGADFKRDADFNLVETSDIIHYQIYINSDNDINTGYSDYHGSDYLIEDGSLFRSTGRNWSWERVQDVESSIEDGKLSIHFENENLENLSHDYTQYTILAKDANWHTLVDFYQGDN